MIVKTPGSQVGTPGSPPAAEEEGGGCSVVESVFIKLEGITSSRGQMVIGRAASAGALAPKPAARQRSRTRISTGFFGVFPLFFEIGRLPIQFFEIGQFFEI